MIKSEIRKFAEKILFQLNQKETLIADFAYSRRKAKFQLGKFWICEHWVAKNSEKCFYLKRKRYYRYLIAQQWE